MAQRESLLPFDLRPVLIAGLAGWLAACAAPPMSGEPPVLRQGADVPAKSEANKANVLEPPSEADVGTSAQTRSPANAEAASAPTTSPDATSTPQSGDRPFDKGLASWYARKFQGRRTASGERYDRRELTAAHRSLPFGTRVRVRSQRTGKEVVVRINDRGPFVRGRVIDLSAAAFDQLGVRGRGVTAVELLPE